MDVELTVIIGMLFSLFMIYLAYISFRRKEFNAWDLALWGGSWSLVMVLLISNKFLYYLVEKTGALSGMDLFTILGFLFLTFVVFQMYRVMKKNHRRIQEITKKIALDEADEVG
jgi:hypothetical protein